VWKWTFRLSPPPNRWITVTAGVAVAKAVPACASSLERQQRARVGCQHGAAQLMVPCQKIAKPAGQAQHPLAYRDMRQDAVRSLGSAGAKAEWLSYPTTTVPRPRPLSFRVRQTINEVR
jgi:hypothetical protein